MDNVLNYTIGFIGAGNMGGAIIRAVCRGTQTGSVLISDLDSAKTAALAAETGCAVAENAAQVAGSCDIVVLCVKPQVLGQTVESIKPYLHTNLIVSIAAGVTLDSLRAMLGGDGPLVRIMPNTPAAIGKGVLLTAFGDKVSPDYREKLTGLLAPCGSVEEVTEAQLDMGSALSGCGPAFVYLFIEALADGAVQIGLPRDKALRYAAQTVEGAAAMVLQSGRHPGELKDAVCSPGGTTIVGVAELEKRAFRAAAAQAVLAAYRKNEELAGK